MESRPWVLNVIRAHGFEVLFTGKSWRPIVSMVLDEHQHHEVILGCDGQNPNLKQSFIMRTLDDHSRVDISVCHQAPSKKKRKKRYQVAATSLSLQALSKLKGTEKTFKIPLNCSRQPSPRGSARPKLVSVYLLVKLEIPETQARRFHVLHDSLTSEDCVDDKFMSFRCSSPASEYESDGTSNFPFSSRAITPPLQLESSRIRVRRGYLSETDDDHPLDEHVKLVNESYEGAVFAGNVEVLAVVIENDDVPLAPSLLPRYTEQISVDNSLSFIDALVDSFSSYRELREACTDSEYERILEKLRSEWCYVGASLVALSGLDAGVFGFSSSSLFLVDSFARRSIALGSVASGIGLAIDGWFLLVYSGTDAKKFQMVARDIYGKYLFFSISSRLPAVCMFASACALMAFLITVAWSAWPKAVLVMCFMAGILISLQFIVYGLHCAVVGLIETIRRVWRGLASMVCKDTVG